VGNERLTKLGISTPAPGHVAQHVARTAGGRGQDIATGPDDLWASSVGSMSISTAARLGT
jgi:hypothetical protein